MRWAGRGQNGKAVTIERAHLFDDPQGRQWWKVKFSDDRGKTTILEGLLDPAQKKFVRMRARFPDDKEGNELPMSDQHYYMPPQKLSAESVERHQGRGDRLRPGRHLQGQARRLRRRGRLQRVVACQELARRHRQAAGQESQERPGPLGDGLAAYGSDAQSELGSK